MRQEAAVFAGKEIEVTIQKKKRSRSSEQNRYYWGVVVEMIRMGIKDLGDEADAEQVHEFLKDRFLPSRERIDEITGELIYRLPASTTALSTIQFSEYVEKCCQFAAEYLGVSIPMPEK